jgi:ABC-type polysaccharide/polyol phosphate transport system ATPase subunit
VASFEEPPKLMHASPRLVGADDLEVLVDEDVVRPVEADVVDLVLAVAQLHNTVDEAPAITTTGLRKSYGEKIVLGGIDLSVAEGTVFALLGPNGAGKTTTVQILSTLLDADGGEAQVGGHDLAHDPNLVRALIGVTGQFSAVDSLLTGQENLSLMADLRHLGRTDRRTPDRDGTRRPIWTK